MKKKLLAAVLGLGLMMSLAVQAGAAEMLVNANMEDGGYEIDAMLELGDAVRDVYGVEFYVTPAGEVPVEDINGNLAVCCPTTYGWDQRAFSITTASVSYDGSTIRWEKGAPVFAEKDYASDEPYCKFLLHSYWGTFEVNGYAYLDADGNVIEPVAPEEAPAAGDTSTATASDSKGGSPDTGIGDVAVFFGIAAVAGGGALALIKKRK